MACEKPLTMVSLNALEMIYLNSPAIMRHAMCYSSGVMPEVGLPGRSVCVLQTISASVNGPNEFSADGNIAKSTRSLALSLKLPVVTTTVVTGCSSSSREPRGANVNHHHKGSSTALHLVHSRLLESVCVDFGVEEGGKLRKRVDNAKPRKGNSEMIYRAVLGRWKGVTDPYVWDFTAGLGRDAFVLASAGCHVVMLERDPIVAALLADGLKRLRQSEESLNIGDGGSRLSRRLSLHCVDSSDVEKLGRIANLERGWPEVAYLDPMFGTNGGRSRKIAKAKLPLQMLQRLLGEDHNFLKDTIEKRRLWEAASSIASLNVVVKGCRNRNPIITEPSPSHSIKGKAVSFHVYNVRRHCK